MSKIIISTLNARYIHASLGCRYLYANMGNLKADSEIQEYIINTRPIDIAEKMLASAPLIIGLGVYIWNIQQCTELAGLIKAISPQTRLVIGGPEISYETEQQQITQYADYVITGQADLAFAELCQQILDDAAPVDKIIHAERPALNTISLPYDDFTDEDVKNRVIYVEASRGCPFKCEFCLSSLDKTAWPFEINQFLTEIQKLFDRGVRSFKFVDRTFNLKIDTSIKILEFFLQKMQPGLFLHFELIPDHLPDKLKEILVKFPDGSLQFEIGIQSFDQVTQDIISRKQNNDKSLENINWLRTQTTAHLHTDLIIGLPGESIESFARGFNQLVSLNPHEIQVGILKRLRGTPIIRHTDFYQMRYNPNPPYNILSNKDISFEQMQTLNRFARYWDMIANSGRFTHALPLILGTDPFKQFMELSNWLFINTDQTHRIALNRLFTLVYQAMTEALAITPALAAEKLGLDFAESGLKGKPVFDPSNQPAGNKSERSNLMRRQARHQ